MGFEREGCVRRRYQLLVLLLFAAAGCSQQSGLSPAVNAATAAQRAGADAGTPVLYSFAGKPDGAIPEAELTVLDGVLYGTTTRGGTSERNNGTVFEIRSDGKERVLHSFTHHPDGSAPEAGLTVLNGLLYGTTSGGGNGENGTVFEVSKNGTERVVYSFKNKPDGSTPAGGLAAINGVLYGTTTTGGDNKDCVYGCGTVFEVRPDGKERVLYSFGGHPDGADPQASSK
jgi:uncharacterized repeat protein (TIGR03803 family)